MKKGEFIPFPLGLASLTLRRKVTQEKEYELVSFAYYISKIHSTSFTFFHYFQLGKLFSPLSSNEQPNYK